jgi:hypothetical protein
MMVGGGFWLVCPNLRQELIDDWFLVFIEKRLAFKMKNPTGVGFPSNGDQE